jgi:hypothetical protein
MLSRSTLQGRGLVLLLTCSTIESSFLAIQQLEHNSVDAHGAGVEGSGVDKRWSPTSNVHHPMPMLCGLQRWILPCFRVVGSYQATRCCFSAPQTTPTLWWLRHRLCFKLQFQGYRSLWWAEVVAFKWNCTQWSLKLRICHAASRSQSVGTYWPGPSRPWRWCCYATHV